ncbi:MAG TPA: glycosyltransferase [Blastocatellia bacterium]|nr:glycosyltransferase [Blastocatellia bacterium]
MKNDFSGDPLVSVIIPCYNSEKTIRLCLEALINQNTSHAFDITVVDSSSDETPHIVEQEFPSVRLIHLEKRTFAGAARNIGVLATRAPFCLMIDSDCIARPDVIESMITRHREAHYAAVGGSLRNSTPASLSGSTGYLLEFRQFMPTAPLRLVNTVPTANATYRREALESYGYFDDDMWLAEDVLFNWKMFKSGELILFDPAIEVAHLNRTGWREVLSYQISLGRCSAQARRRGGLPGDVLLRYPALILLMPLVRLVRAAGWLAKTDREALLMFLLISPMYFFASCLWGFGFFQGAIGEQISLSNSMG